MLLRRTNKILAAPIITTLIIMALYPGQIQAQSGSVAPKIVHAGGGNATSPMLNFVPQQVGIKAGESITWVNPTPVAEPHSVTFMKDKKFFADFVAPFNVPNSTEFKSPQPDLNTEPIIVPSQSADSKLVMTVNARAVSPVVIDSNGKVTYLSPNGNYTMDGTENYINAGWLWPNELAPPGGPAINNFTMTFEKPGTYAYSCNVHPWMTGLVTVN
jgi:plastocyanin